MVRLVAYTLSQLKTHILQHFIANVSAASFLIGLVQTHRVVEAVQSGLTIWFRGHQFKLVHRNMWPEASIDLSINKAGNWNETPRNW